MAYGYNEYRLHEIDMLLTPTLQEKDEAYYNQLKEEKQQLLQEMLQDTKYTKDWKQKIIDKGGNY